MPRHHPQAFSFAEPLLQKDQDAHKHHLCSNKHFSSSGIAGPLAAWCSGQICRPIVLGFGKWIACLKPCVLMPKVTCSIYSILVSSWHTRVCWYNGFLCNYQCSIAVIKLQFLSICCPLSSAAWCGPHSPQLFSNDPDPRLVISSGFSSSICS